MRLYLLLRRFSYWVRTAGYHLAVWHAYDGRVTRVQEMRDDYLLNVLRFILRRQPYERADRGVSINLDHTKFFTHDTKKRKPKEPK